MKEVYDFLKQAGVFYLATVDNNKPRVRPFGAVNIYNDKLYIQTGKSKKVYEQIVKNPYIEISAFNNGKWIRLSGKLVDDNEREAKVSMLEENPELKSMYSADDDNTRVLYLTEAKADICSFTEKTKTVEF